MLKGEQRDQARKNSLRARPTGAKERQQETLDAKRQNKHQEILQGQRRKEVDVVMTPSQQPAAVPAPPSAPARASVPEQAQAAADTPVSSPMPGTNKRKAVGRLEEYVGDKMTPIEAQDGTSYTVNVANTQAEKDYKASTKSIAILLGDCCEMGKKETLYLQMVLLFAQTKENFKVSYDPASDPFLQTNIPQVVELHFSPKNSENELHKCTAFLALCMAARKIIGIKSSKALYDTFKNDVEFYSEDKLGKKVQVTAQKQPPYYYLVSDLAARLELDARTNFPCYTTADRTIHGIAAFMAKAQSTRENTTELQQMLTILQSTQKYKTQALTAASASSSFRNANIGTMMLRLRFH